MIKPIPIEWSADYKREAMTYEQDRAQMEAERNAADTPIKSDHALILNRLSEMQRAPCYATIIDELALAEQTIVHLERGWNERNKKVIELQARIDELEPITKSALTDDEILKLIRQIKEPI